MDEVAVANKKLGDLLVRANQLPFLVCVIVNLIRQFDVITAQ